MLSGPMQAAGEPGRGGALWQRRHRLRRGGRGLVCFLAAEALKFLLIHRKLLSWDLLKAIWVNLYE